MRLRSLSVVAAGVVFLQFSSASQSAEIRGQYLEARSCDVYTGPCFANGEMGMAGKEAVLAWRVDAGTWKGTSLEGLSVALVLKAENSLGDDGIFPMQAGRIKSVILVDEQADERQQAALIAFVKEAAADYTQEIQKVSRAPITLKANQVTHESVFKAGDLAEIRTRSLSGNDCICTNETVFFKPLTDVLYAAPTYSVTQSYAGDGLDSKWTLHGSRSSFLAVFRK